MSKAILAQAHPALSELDAEQWDACAGNDDPFVSYAFLSALEDSDCVNSQTGWQPYHISISDGQGGYAAVMPMYVKGHSQGEYIFDYGWADAYERAGGDYYPKLLVAIPFTPVTGPRLLVRADQDRPLLQKHLALAGIEAAKQLKLSSLHINFPTEDEYALLGDMGFLQRNDQQFHWFNDDYQDFDDFLSALSSRKRKAIRKERKQACAADIDIEILTGSDLREAHWDAFYTFYMDTGGRKWGRPYLNRHFFSLISERMADNIVLFLCRREGNYIAGALNFRGANNLYGRNWGCIEDHKFLHFETCYYQAIDYAIQHGLKKVEAGAQGPHKLARGYVPTRIHSSHWIVDPRFRRAVDDYLAHERREVAGHIRHLSDYTPFRKTNGTGEP